MERNGKDELIDPENYREELGASGEAAVYREFKRLGNTVYPINESFTLYKYLKDEIDTKTFFGLDIEVEGKARSFAIQCKSKLPRRCKSDGVHHDTGIDEYQWQRLLNKEEQVGRPFILLLFIEQHPIHYGTGVVIPKEEIKMYGDWIAVLKSKIWNARFVRNGHPTLEQNGAFGDENQPCHAYNAKDRRWMVYWRVDQLRKLQEILTSLVGYK